MSEIDIEVKGLIELQRKTEQMIADLRGAPILDAMRDSVLIVTRGAKQNAPVDTGRLRASITPGVSETSDGAEGVVGSNVEYAPYQEFGTGEYSLAISGFRRMVRRFLKRGGIRPKLYLTRAFKDKEDAIKQRFDRALNEAVKK